MKTRNFCDIKALVMSTIMETSPKGALPAHVHLFCHFVNATAVDVLSRTLNCKCKIFFCFYSLTAYNGENSVLLARQFLCGDICEPVYGLLTERTTYVTTSRGTANVWDKVVP
jgi:hypothetical protein